jgi:hypothetical protein
MDIIEAFFNKNKIYNILFSGLDKNIIDLITNTLKNDLKHVRILNFLHIELDDKFNNMFNIVNNRIETVLEQQSKEPQILFILCKSFPKELINFSFLFHFHISFNENYLIENNINVPNYNEVLKSNIINKFFNFKLITADNSPPTSNIQELITLMFDFIVNDIQERLYGINFKSKLSFYNIDPVKTEQDNNDELEEDIDDEINNIDIEQDINEGIEEDDIDYDDTDEI